MTRAGVGWMEAVRAVGVGRSSAMLAVLALPLIGLIVGLGIDQFARQRAALLADVAALTNEQHYAVSTMLASADRQLGRMRLVMADAIAENSAAPIAERGPELRLTAAALEHARIEGTEWLPAGAPSDDGNLIGVPDLGQRGVDEIGPVDAALDMLGAVALENRLGSSSHWSYFFSARGDFITIHPYVALADIATAAGKPVESVEELVTLWLSYDVFRLGRPEQNPDRAPYWTAVYEDAGGAGPMVSHAAPVDVGGRFYGIVGTDVLLSEFQKVLSHMRQPVGLLAIVDAGGDVLGVNGVSYGGDRAAMRRHLQGELALEASPPDEAAFRRIGDDWVLARSFPGSPFRLLSVLPAADVHAYLLPRFAPYGWILFGLAATLAGLLYFLHRNYVRPSFAFANYLAAQAGGNAATPPRLPRLWQTSLDRVSDLFANDRSYQARLEAGEARFQAAMDSLPDGFAIFDPAGRTAFHNKAFPGLVGRDAGAMLAGTMLADLDVPEASAAQPVRRGDRWIECHRAPMPDGGVVILLQEVTAAREAELTIRESEARYRTVVNTQTEFVARYDPYGVPTFANDAYWRYMSLEPEDIARRNISDFTFILEEDRAAHDAHLRALNPERPTATIVFRSILPDGTFHWEEWTDTGIFDENGVLLEVQSVGRDITEQKRAEEALRQSEKMAALGSLLAGVAHELNNPLSVVVGYSSMLQDLASDEATRRRAREIHVAAERCARIVKTFLAMARSRPAEKVPVDIGGVLADVVELAAYGLRSNGVEVVMAVEESLPPVLADRDQLHQVFMNLTLNAQQAMMAVSGPRRLTISAGRDGGNVAVTLLDTGHGIDAEAKKRAFEPFFTTKPQGVGTGIGLSVCLGIVQVHGGTISLEPAPQGGAICRVELPAADANPAAEPARDIAAPRLRGHVLVVDDEPGIAAYLAESLEGMGLRVTAMTSGVDAQAALAAQSFDAVLTDLRMPDIGGDRLVRFIAERFPDMVERVIVMTGDALGSETALDAAVAAIIEKPVDPRVLRDTLAGILAKQSSGRMAAAN